MTIRMHVVNLILEDRQGTITCYFKAIRTTVLINDVHTNVIVKYFENAIKYSPMFPKLKFLPRILRYGLLFKVKDSGLGMSK
jgi:two-component system phosphate regulon sensor histidine kinase PhoR